MFFSDISRSGDWQFIMAGAGMFGPLDYLHIEDIFPRWQGWNFSIGCQGFASWPMDVEKAEVVAVCGGPWHQLEQQLLCGQPEILQAAQAKYQFAGNHVQHISFEIYDPQYD
ncbi:MAG TPA: hypothetical protein DET40_24605 [Lentisphaeria bacterium]|nr:MAG: hypothetical protein A2X45_22890 [Lentisphaerae bacterium GWF2_50_93]HCE46741.1 hypothetical protein [Lentisphaeria bacterium]